MPFVSLNWISILVAAIAYVVIGAIWYSPSVFGKAWMKSMGMDMKSMKKTDMSMNKMIVKYIWVLVAGFILALILSILIHVLGTDLTTALQIGLLVWVGFVATEKLGSVLWEGRHFNYYVITSFLLWGSPRNRLYLFKKREP